MIKDLSIFLKIQQIFYNLNRALIRPIQKKTPYELWNGRKSNISYFHVFGCKCYIHNNEKDNLENFDARSNEGIFLGYATTSKAYRVFNKRALVIEESIHMVFDESNDYHIEKNIDEEENLLPNKLDKLDINESNVQENKISNETPKDPNLSKN